MRFARAGLYRDESLIGDQTVMVWLAAVRSCF